VHFSRPSSRKILSENDKGGVIGDYVNLEESYLKGNVFNVRFGTGRCWK